MSLWVFILNAVFRCSPEIWNDQAFQTCFQYTLTDVTTLHQVVGWSVMALFVVSMTLVALGVKTPLEKVADLLVPFGAVVWLFSYVEIWMLKIITGLVENPKWLPDMTCFALLVSVSIVLPIMLFGYFSSKEKKTEQIPIS